MTDPPSAGEPPQQLKGYDKTWLAPGESKLVSITLPLSAFQYWNDGTGQWTKAPGVYAIHLGDSSADETLEALIRR